MIGYVDGDYYCYWEENGKKRGERGEEDEGGKKEKRGRLLLYKYLLHVESVAKDFQCTRISWKSSGQLSHNVLDLLLHDFLLGAGR